MLRCAGNALFSIHYLLLSHICWYSVVIIICFVLCCFLLYLTYVLTLALYLLITYFLFFVSVGRPMVLLEVHYDIGIHMG
jgi:hypothetical protein